MEAPCLGSLPPTSRHQKGGFLMSRVPPYRRSRAGRRSFVAIVSCAVAACLVAVAVQANRSLGSREKEPLTCRVVKGDFAHEVSVQGEVESAVNAEVRCEVH